MPYIHGHGNQQPSGTRMSKKCPGCGVEKPLSEYIFRPSKQRHSSRCRACISIRNRAYYEARRSEIIAATATYYRNNKEQYREWQRGYQARKHREWKRAALAVYGEKCACCGEDGFEFLTLDHVENDGHLHRREINKRNIYEWLEKVGYNAGYELQTLCFNCNFAKRYNGGVCPHQCPEGSTTIPSGSTPRARRKRGTPSSEG